MSQASDNPQVEERTPRPPVDLSEIGARLLDEARSGEGRSAVTLTPAEGGALKQTLIALRAGNELTEHPSPGPASIHVLSGSGALTVAGEDTSLTAGQWAPIPLDKHGLRADEDVVALLTIVRG